MPYGKVSYYLRTITYSTYRVGDSELKKVLLPILALVLAVGLALPAAAHTEDDPFVTDLIAGQHEDVGDVKVWNDGTNLYVQYETTGGWVLKETHLAVAEELNGIPQTKKGNPIPGKFPYSTQHDPLVTMYTYEIELGDWEPGTELCIATHAAVSLQDHSKKETAWGGGCEEGMRFVERGNWATYFEYAVQHLH